MTSRASLRNLNEHTAVLDQNLGNQLRTGEDQRRDLQRKLDDLNQRLQRLAERLVALEAAQRVSRNDGDGIKRGY